MKKTGLFLTIVAAAGLVGAGWLVLQYWDFAPAGTPKTPVNGGGIVSTYRSEPSTFNRLVKSGSPESLMTRLVHDTLLRMDRKTGQLEPRLATTWTPSPDGLTWTLALRQGVLFSDGQPFTSADVMFSVRAVYDPAVASPLASSLRVGGKPIAVRAMDAHTITVQFPSAYAPGISLLEALPIMPAHKLGAALDAGKFREAWSVTTPPADIVGLGPFVIDSYKAGERLVFKRNPHFWKRDADGRAMPYLDRIELQITPSQDTEVLRLQAGAADLTTDRVRVEDLASLQSLSSGGKIALHSAGVSVSPDMFIFNLDPASASARERPWLQREEFRHAISKAVDRVGIVNTVFLGEGLPIAGPITPGHGEWYAADLVRFEYDVNAANKALDAMGLVDKTGDGLRDDPSGRTVSFSVLTLKGHSVRERTVVMIQEHLRRVGIKVNVVAMEKDPMLDLFGDGNYDVMYFSTEFDSFDPGRNLDFWLSSGSFHVWRLGQTSPGTPWEQEIDSLMTRQVATFNMDERRKLFADAQRVLAAHAPVLYFAAPNVVVATSARLGGVTASVLAPNVLWNPEALFIKSSTTGAQR